MKTILSLASGLTLLLSAGATAEVNPPAPPPGIDALAPMVLNGYSRFPRSIGSAPVYDLDAHRVGLVKALNADASGKPASIEIWLPTGRTFTVTASNIGYDEQLNIVTAGLTDAQLGVAPSPARP